MGNERINIVAVAVSQYDELQSLPGPKNDLLGVKWLFTGDEVGLYGESRLDVLEDCTGEVFRSWIAKYASNRSASGDILVLYFSGHGTVVGTGEFAFCPKDTKVRPDGKDVYPLSVVRFSDVLDTLTGVGVYPIFIIDACYSGAAAGSFSPEVVLTLMQNTTHKSAGSSYAILCACSSRDTTIDTREGGVFTETLLELTEKGISNQKRNLRLTMLDVFPTLQFEFEKRGEIGTPKLYVGPSLPRFELCRNAAYQVLSYNFAPYMAKIVRAMWNDGAPKTMTIDEISQLARGSYGNHRKLSYQPWGLLEDGNQPKERKLTTRGIEFAKGKRRIPRKIRATRVVTTDPDSWEAVPGTEEVGINDLL